MRQEIPFIRAVREVPREMRDRLPQEYMGALDTRVMFPWSLLLSLLTL